MKKTLGILVALTSAVLIAACSSPSAPTGATGGATASTQAIVTNAPGGIPVPAPPAQGASCQSVIPSVRIESDWPKATHLSADWGHSDTAVYVEFTLRLRDRPTVLVVKPNEHTNGAGQVSHHVEITAPLGIYDGEVSYIYASGCKSRPFTFNGLNHGQASLPGISLSTPGLGNQPPW
jgi:hypothetical protein